MLHNMLSKVQQRHKVIELRRQGKSYKEIMAILPVSKGTISKWCSNLPLTRKEEKYLRERSMVLQDKGRLKVALQNRERNEKRRDKIRLQAQIDFERYKKDPFFLVGLTLYWGEGAQKNNYVSFINSDISMIQIMNVWMPKFFRIEPVDIKYRLYIHKAYAKEKLEQFWSRECTIPLSQFQRTIYKPNPHTVKKYPEYKGCLRMVVSGVDYLITVCTWQECLATYALKISDDH